MGQRNDVYTLYPESYVLGTGITCLIQPMPFQNSVWLQYGSGGTLFVQGASFKDGSTFASGVQYPVPTAQMEIHLCGTLCLTATGATTTFYLLRGRSEGSPQP